MLICHPVTSRPLISPQKEPAFIQRAVNGGLDPSWLDLAFLGRPDFQSTENWGAPKTPNPTMTDPTPHSRPSDLSPCNFATTHLTASILNFYLPLTSRPMKWRTLSQRPDYSENSRRLELSISKNTPHRSWGQGPGSVDPRFPQVCLSRCPKS